MNTKTTIKNLTTEVEFSSGEPETTFEVGYVQPGVYSISVSAVATADVPDDPSAFTPSIIQGGVGEPSINLMSPEAGFVVGSKDSDQSVSSMLRILEPGMFRLLISPNVRSGKLTLVLAKLD